jgi:hypothetical protein
MNVRITVKRGLIAGAIVVALGSASAGIAAAANAETVSSQTRLSAVPIQGSTSGVPEDVTPGVATLVGPVDPSQQGTTTTGSR